MAVMAPLAMTAMLGTVEVGYAFMIKQTVTLAAREGARAGALPGGTLSDVESAVDEVMQSANLSDFEQDTNVDELEAEDLEIWVSVSVPLNRASFTGSLLGGGNFTVSSTATMRREGMDNGSDQDGISQ